MRKFFEADPMEDKAGTGVKTGYCINCSQEVNTPYCSQCGQPFPPQRMSIGHVFADFQGRPYGTRGLFWRTIKDLTLKPGEVVRSYVMGNRVLYNRPIGYFFLMITLMLITASLLNVDYVEFLKGSSPPIQSTGTDQEKFNRFIFQFISDHIKLLSFIVIPFQALVARYFFFRKSGYSYLDHTVLPFYIEGHLNILMMISILIFKITAWQIPFWVMSLLSPVYFAFAYMGFITHQSKVKSFLKGAGIFIVAQFLIAILSVIGGVIYIINHPEVIEQFKK